MSEVERAMRYGPAIYPEKQRVELLSAALADAYDRALEEAAQNFDRMMAEGNTEPLTPRGVAGLLRNAKSKKAVTP